MNKSKPYYLFLGLMGLSTFIFVVSSIYMVTDIEAKRRLTNIEVRVETEQVQQVSKQKVAKYSSSKQGLSSIMMGDSYDKVYGDESANDDFNFNNGEIKVDLSYITDKHVANLNEATLYALDKRWQEIKNQTSDKYWGDQAYLKDTVLGVNMPIYLMSITLAEGSGAFEPKQFSNVISISDPKTSPLHKTDNMEELVDIIYNIDSDFYKTYGVHPVYSTPITTNVVSQLTGEKITEYTHYGPTYPSGAWGTLQLIGNRVSYNVKFPDVAYNFDYLAPTSMLNYTFNDFANITLHKDLQEFINELPEEQRPYFYIALLAVGHNIGSSVYNSSGALDPFPNSSNANPTTSNRALWYYLADITNEESLKAIKEDANKKFQEYVNNDYKKVGYNWGTFQKSYLNGTLDLNLANIDKYPLDPRLGVKGTSIMDMPIGTKKGPGLTIANRAYYPIQTLSAYFFVVNCYTGGV